MKFYIKWKDVNGLEEEHSDSKSLITLFNCSTIRCSFT